jgi:hypothetical protein
VFRVRYELGSYIPGHDTLHNETSFRYDVRKDQVLYAESNLFPLAFSPHVNYTDRSSADCRRNS